MAAVLPKKEDRENLVQGKILNEASGRGIPDLLVVIYDIDPVERIDLPDFGDAEDPIKNIDDEVDPTSVDSTTPAAADPPNFTIEQANRRDARTWVDFPGDRLGSVLTDSSGRFSLTYDDESFRVGDKEKRPDLVLMVMGPDRDKGMSVVSRLLHYSYVPRNNSGRIESYIIHISDKNLSEKIPHSKLKGPDLQAYFKRLSSDEIVGRREELKEKSKLIPQWLTPRALSSSKTFLPKTATQAEVDALLKTTIETGIPLVMAAEMRPMVMYMEASEVPPPETVKACDALALKGIGTELVRIRDLITEKREKDETARLAALASNTEPTTSIDEGTSDAGETPIIAVDEGRDFVTSRILGQVATLSSYEQGKSKGIIDDLQTIKDRINQLEMNSGPANVTAFRDFHSLQIAFENVWTTAFDKELESDVKRLYKQVNELNIYYGARIPRPEDDMDLDEFENMILSIETEYFSDEDVTSSENPVLYRYQGVFNCDITTSQWNSLNLNGRERLSDALVPYHADIVLADKTVGAPTYETIIRNHRPRILEVCDNVLNNEEYFTEPYRLKRLIKDIGTKLSEPYAFKYYKEYSVNYGILVSYRQEWRPKNYQVGRLVSTLPLAPGEARELKVNHKIKRTRAEKEMRKALSENSYETSSTIKSELDVLAKLSTDTNFKLSAEGSFSIGIVDIGSTSEFSHNQKAESQRQHKNIAEATRKASEKVRQEREVSIEQSQESEFTSEATQKIHNPNNEVTVTYLMYELERRYEVAQKLNKVTPVIMVALDLPSPHELTEGWVLEHSWILKRVLLDDMFYDAISIIEDGRQSDEVDIAVKKAAYQRDQNMLAEVEAELESVLADRRAFREDIINLKHSSARYDAGDDGTVGDVRDFFASGGLSLLFGSSEPDQGELYQAAIEAAKSRLKFIEENAEQMATRQRAAKKEAREAGNQYAEAIKARTQKDTVVKQLLLHLRQNIFHYMHAIWEMKHPDELLFQLAEQQVHHIGSGNVTCTFRPITDPDEVDRIPGIVRRDGVPYSVECGAPEPPDLDEKKPLGSIAHIDRLLGFKGNYAIFPLKECTFITDHMMTEFVDDYFGVRDPANEVGLSTSELIEYAEEMISSGAVEGDEKDALVELVKRSLSSPSHNIEEIILPTGQIYMEALKGEQALLEDFKLAHRGMDVLKVQEEIRTERLDNLRRAGRMVGSEPDYGDPEIDKVIKVDGDTNVIVDPE
jgi:hypothetical protein